MKYIGFIPLRVDDNDVIKILWHPLTAGGREFQIRVVLTVKEEDISKIVIIVHENATVFEVGVRLCGNCSKLVRPLQDLYAPSQ